MKRVEYIVAKGEIAHGLLTHFFQKSSVRHISIKMPLKRVNLYPHIGAFRRLCSRQLFKNIVTKEIAQNKQFLLLPQTAFHF